MRRGDGWYLELVEMNALIKCDETHVNSGVVQAGNHVVEGGTDSSTDGVQHA